MKDFPLWIEARKRHGLSHGQIQMARELGMNPKKLGKLANHRQEPWKLPLPQFIQELYLKRFGRPWPESVLSLEERAQERKQEKQEQKERREQRPEQGVRTLGAETQTFLAQGPSGSPELGVPTRSGA